VLCEARSYLSIYNYACVNNETGGTAAVLLQYDSQFAYELGVPCCLVRVCVRCELYYDQCARARL